MRGAKSTVIVGVRAAESGVSEATMIGKIASGVKADRVGVTVILMSSDPLAVGRFVGAAADWVLLASSVYFSVTGQRPAIHEVLILIFVSLTTPVTLMLLARAALYRDRAEENGTVPDSMGQDTVVKAD